MPVFQLSQDLVFPHPTLAESDGLLAIGGDLSVERLLLAYRFGIFPWFSEDDPILWFAPKERFVLFPYELHVSKSMRSLLNKQTYTCTINKDFEGVISNCKSIERNGEDGTWITSDMKSAYIEMNKRGHAMSIETWNSKNELVGGLYGVVIGKVFFGESMFHKESNTSKLALIALCQLNKFNIIDCQMKTEHLSKLGARDISLATFLKILVKECNSN